MSTNASIAMEENGIITGIYTHWDGYPEHHGPILIEHYHTPEQVKALMALGDLSVLAEEVGSKHPFHENGGQPREGWCRAYHRDRGEDWEAVKPRQFTRVEDWIGCYAEACVRHFYLFKNRSWHYAKLDAENHISEFEPLTPAIRF